MRRQLASLLSLITLLLVGGGATQALHLATGHAGGRWTGLTAGSAEPAACCGHAANSATPNDRHPTRGGPVGDDCPTCVMLASATPAALGGAAKIVSGGDLVTRLVQGVDRPVMATGAGPCATRGPPTRA